VKFNKESASQCHPVRLGKMKCSKQKSSQTLVLITCELSYGGIDFVQRAEHLREVEHAVNEDGCKLRIAMIVCSYRISGIRYTVVRHEDSL
jgi:hypothetical protein